MYSQIIGHVFFGGFSVDDVAVPAEASRRKPVRESPKATSREAAASHYRGGKSIAYC